MNFKPFLKFSFLLVICTTANAGLQDPVLLKRKLVSGEKELFQVDTQTNLSADAPGGVRQGTASIQSTIETATGNVQGGRSADYTISTTTTDVNATGILDSSKTSKSSKVVVRANIDVQNRITRAKVVGDAPQANVMSLLGGVDAAQLGLFIQFPADSVKIGDTWTVLIPSSGMTGAQDQSLSGKFLGTRDVDGRKMNVISLSGTLNVEPSAETIAKANASGGASGMDVKIKGTADISGESLVDPQTGETYQSLTHIKGKLDFVIVQLSSTMRVNSDTTVKMVRRS